MKGELYNFNQHTHHICIYLGEAKANIEIFRNLPRSVFSIIPLEKQANIIYNKQKTNVLSWGATEFEPKEFCVVYDDFMNRLYQLFKKDRYIWDEEDIFFTEAMSQFLKLLIEGSIEEWCEKKSLPFLGYLESLDFLHYAFIVPSEWEVEIQEDLIRPIFIKANLISKNDHKDRLLFITDLESMCYYLQREVDKNFSFSHRVNTFTKDESTTICRCSLIDRENALIKIDLVKTTNLLFDIPDSTLFPKVMRSDSFSITSTIIKNSIKKYLQQYLFTDKQSAQKKNHMNIIADKICNKSLDENRDLMRCFFSDSEEWGLDNSQTKILNSVRPIDICPMFDENLLNRIRVTCPKILGKKHRLLILGKSSFFELFLNISVTIWLKIEGTQFIDLEEIHLIIGASRSTKKTIQNSDMYCIPCVIPNENQNITKNSKSDAIINIDVALKSTSISCSILNHDGLVVEIFDHDYFTSEKCLPSLESFYDIASQTTLKTKEDFISFVEKHVWNNSKSLYIDEDFLFQIEAILCEGEGSKDKEVSTQQQKYIEAFLLIYFLYIKSIISSKLPVHRISEEVDVPKIYYAITIEKVLLNNIFGSKEDFKEQLLTSGFITRNDDSKNLRIVTKGEEILSLIQPLMKLEFLVRSYFVLTQLHESYIQFTLNQVVTTFNLEDKQQETIIIEDRIIFIEDIYDSLSLNMWNNFIQNSSLIQLCDIHNRYYDEGEISELFSLKTKKEFTANYKKCISKHILAHNSDLQKVDNFFVKMNHSCDCTVNLTLNDVVEISFKPFLKSITSICMGSLINDNMFKKYRNIDYHLTLIHFNQNRQFLQIIIDILKEECEDFNPWRGIDTRCLTIPEIPVQLFQPTLNLQPYLYKGFLIGTLQQVYTENYALSIRKK